MSLWLVTTGEPSTQGPGNPSWCVFVDTEDMDEGVELADSPEAVAAYGAEWIMEESSDFDQLPGCVAVLRLDGPPERYRLIAGAERVPDEFQCCGGMPRICGLGTLNQHTGVCPNRTKDEDEQEREPEPDAGWPPQ
jgi:hypothetical protein